MYSKFRLSIITSKSHLVLKKDTKFPTITYYVWKSSILKVLGIYMY